MRREFRYRFSANSTREQALRTLVRYRFSAPHPPALPRLRGRERVALCRQGCSPAPRFACLNCTLSGERGTATTASMVRYRRRNRPFGARWRCAPHAASGAAIDPVSAWGTVAHRMAALASGARSAAGAEALAIKPEGSRHAKRGSMRSTPSAVPACGETPEFDGRSRNSEPRTGPVIRCYRKENPSRV